MAWEKNGTPDTLGSSGDVLQITDLDAKKFNLFLLYSLDVTDSINSELSFNGIGADDYARRRSFNGAADSLQTSQDTINQGDGGADEKFGVIYSINISGEEKLVIWNSMQSSIAGAGNAPDRSEGVGKMDTSTLSAQYTRVDIDNANAGSYDTDSNLSALGTN